MKRHLLSIVASCVLLVAVATSASAAGFALYEWSARGNALGGTLVGRADDPSAVAYNPAGLTQLEGTHIAIGSSFAAPIAEVEIDGQGDTKSNPALFPIPHFYVTHQLNDKWYVGFGEYSRFGLGFGYDSDWPGSNNVYDAKIISFSLNPNIAYKITDRLSAAIGIEYVYVDVTIKKTVPNAGPLNGGKSQLTGAGDGYALTAGLHYKLDDWRFGVGYHSQAKVKANGRTKVTGNQYNGMGVIPPNLNGDYDTKSTIILPDMISAGITYYPTDALSIELAAVYTRWSTYKNFDLYVENFPTGEDQPQPKDWDDVWRVSLGAEYDINDTWTVRGSYCWDEAPENDKYVDYMIPAANRHLFGTGVGYKVDNWTVDLAYTLILAESVNYDDSVASGVQDGKSKNGITHIGAVTVGYSF